MKLSPRIAEMLKAQIQRELNACFVYNTVAGWAAREGLLGASAFFKHQAEEEYEHFRRIADYLDQMNVEYQVGPVSPPEVSVSSLEEALRLGLSMEEENTRALLAIVQAAHEEQDWTTFQWMQWFVEEQREEEDTFRTLLDRLRLAGPATLLIDAEMAQKAKEED